MKNENQTDHSQNLIRLGVILFLLGLITGFVVPFLQNPRMGLSSHLEGVLNGILLIVFGLIWPKLKSSIKLNRLGYYLAIYGTFTNWLTTLLAAIWGAGSEMMPLSGMNKTGSAFQEILIKFGLISLSLSMIVVSVIILFGLRSKVDRKSDKIF